MTVESRQTVDIFLLNENTVEHVHTVARHGDHRIAQISSRELTGRKCLNMDFATRSTLLVVRGSTCPILGQFSTVMQERQFGVDFAT